MGQDNPSSQTRQINLLLDRVNAGDASARAELIERTCKRLHRMVKQQLRGFPLVRRWEETSDVLQNLLIEVARRLEKARPKNAREYYALSATILRCKLIDLKNHYFGPEGMGAHHHSKDAQASGKRRGGEIESPAPKSNSAIKSLEAKEVHEAVESLPAELREVTDLLFYHGLSQAEASEVLNQNPKWVSRRWRDARLALSQKLGC